ncbi:MAG: hypothetical protein ACOX6Y_12775 [Christensenellales bacterium]
MIKRLLMLCLVMMFLLPCVQSEGIVPLPPPHRLEPVEWLDKDAEYTLISHKTPIIADPLMLALMGEGNEGVSSDADTEQATASGESLQEQGLYVLSVSPDGQRTLLSEGNQLFLLTGNTLRAVALNLSRCAITKREGMRQSMRYASMKPAQMVGSEGFRWSPDGRYICLLNARLPLVQFRPIPLMLIDAEKGEMFSIRAYEKGMGMGIATAMQGMFSPDSQHLYYTEYLGFSARLCRYDLIGETHELLADTHQELLAYPAMGMNENGDILCVMGARENALLTFREGAGGWGFTQQALPRLSVSHFAASGQGAIMELLPADMQTSKVQLVRYKGQMWRVTAEQKSYGLHFLLGTPGETTQEALSDIQQGDEEDAQAPIIRHITMSPSGNRYLLVTELQDEEKSLRFILLNLQPEESLAEVVLPEEAEISLPFIQRNNPRYPAGITFLAEDLLLVPGKNHTQLYRLVCDNPF